MRVASFYQGPRSRAETSVATTATSGADAETAASGTENAQWSLTRLQTKLKKSCDFLISLQRGRQGDVPEGIPVSRTSLPHAGRYSRVSFLPSVSRLQP